MKRSIFASTFTLLLAVALFSCEKEDNTPIRDHIDTTEEFTARLTSIYNESDAPGFAVTVIQDDAVIYQKTFGKADIEAGRPYTDQTTQPIGSISKTFVAAAVVKAIEQGHFTLETDINDILPAKVVNPKRPDATITVRHLVTHSSGLLDRFEAYLQAYHILPGEDMSTPGAQLLHQGFGIQQRSAVPLEDFLAEYYLEDGDLYSPDNFADVSPGSAWSYSNLATSLTAYLVETAAGMPFQDYVRTHILQPLGMQSTAYDIADQSATLYWDINTPLPAYANDSYPDGSVHSSNEDMTRFLMDMMKGVKGQSTALFSAESYGLLFNALLPDGLVPPQLGQNQGVFWFMSDGMIRHDGSDPGATCQLEFTKTGDFGYLLLTNMDASSDENEAAYFQLATQITDAISTFIQE